ncbi:hypothetical protein GCM10017714_33750 [Curtobacterium pusillum]|uniref:DUF3017 domain-containing protein n=1 Tax=Curtobacterium pusillum TaxID=69373 RepID=A0ABX2MAG8_9MICO|nr:hypothetical protein [Curtobacterium pusillum]NUU12701.1 hypothetical protein [Curtobacterium pusillum]GLK31591.1 hypothetical protein GCM10017610_18760 [Curtobacterium pusillum]
MTDPRRDDPELVRNQPALRTSNGGVWLAWGAVTVVVVGVVMGFMAALEPGIGWAALVVVVALFLAMVVVRFTVGPLRPRLATMAVLDVLIVLVGLVSVIAVLVAESRP